MTEQQLIQKQIKEFLMLEAMAEQLKARCYNARISMECFYAPSPKGKKKPALSDADKAKILTKFRKSLHKKAV